MKQTLYLQLWHGNYRVRKPVPKHLIELVGKGQYITKTVGTANFAEAKRRAPAVLAEFEAIFAEAAKEIGPMEWGWLAAPVDPLTYFDVEAGQHRTIEFQPGMVRGMVPVGTLPPGYSHLDPNEFPPLKNSPENPVPIGPVPFVTIVTAWGSETKAAKPTQRAYTSKANRLIAHLGFDDMARVTLEQMIRYKDHLLTSDLDHATIGNHLSALHTLFRYAKRNRKITTDPMAELVFKAKSDGRAKRMPFSGGDRALVLAHAMQSTNPIIKWSNLLSGFSGMRLAEIVEADARDVQVIDDSMVVFRIALDHRPIEMTIKNVVSHRSVPIHGAVIAAGFLDYVKSIRTGPLFPGVSIDHDGRKATNASRIISEWLREVVGITDPRLVFHSHRHSVKSILRNHEAQPRVDLVNKILGHIGGKDDSGRDQGTATAADGYGIFQLRAMQRIVELIPDHREKEVAIAA